MHFKTKITAGFFLWFHKADLKLMWKNKWPKIVKLGGGATIGRFVLFDLKIYYRATVTKLYSFDESIHT